MKVIMNQRIVMEKYAQANFRIIINQYHIIDKQLKKNIRSHIQQLDTYIVMA